MLSDRINRWRHRRGFGVHSPAAYMLVRDVVRPRRGYRYYGERRAWRMKMNPTDLRLCRLALRLMGRLRAKRVEVPYGSPLYHLLLKENLWFSTDIKTLKSPKEGGTEAVPFIRVEFEVNNTGRGEAMLFGRLKPTERELVGESRPGSLIIEGRRFLILYNAPGLTELHVTV